MLELKKPDTREYILCEGMDGKVVLEYFEGDRNVSYHDCSGCFLGLRQSKLIKSRTLDGLINLIICKLIKS